MDQTVAGFNEAWTTYRHLHPNAEARQDDYIKGICFPEGFSFYPVLLQLDRWALLLHSHQKDGLSLISKMIQNQKDIWICFNGHIYKEYLHRDFFYCS